MPPHPPLRGDLSPLARGEVTAGHLVQRLGSLGDWNAPLNTSPRLRERSAALRRRVRGLQTEAPKREGRGCALGAPAALGRSSHARLQAGGFLQRLALRGVGEHRAGDPVEPDAVGDRQPESGDHLAGVLGDDGAA